MHLLVFSHLVAVAFYTQNYLKHLLPVGVSGVYCVLRNSCGQDFSYVINGPEAIYLGEGDLHEQGYNDYEVIIELDEISGISSNDSVGACKYWFSVYPSAEFQSDYETNAPLIFSICVAGAFLLMIITFFVYDWSVIQKNNRVIGAAARSNAIVSVRTSWSEGKFECCFQNLLRIAF